MAEKKSGRMQLNDDQVVEVNGGLLSIRLEDDGYCYLQVRDTNFNMVKHFKIKKSAREASQLMEKMYWNFEAGTRDQSMVDWFAEHGYI